MDRINFSASNDTRIEIMELYREGNSARKISEKLNISITNIYDILEYYNIARKYSGRYVIPDEEIEIIKKRIDNGEYMTKIADERGVTISAISHLLKRRRK